MANYFKKAKPRSKIILLDGNPDIASKKGLFTWAWNTFPTEPDKQPGKTKRGQATTGLLVLFFAGYLQSKIQPGQGYPIGQT